MANIGLALSDDSDIWYLDSGATNHMTCHREWLHYFDPTDAGEILLGDNTMLKSANREWNTHCHDHHR